MKILLIEEVSNGWIVREPELVPYLGQPYESPKPPFVYRTISIGYVHKESGKKSLRERTGFEKQGA